MAILRKIVRLKYHNLTSMQYKLLGGRNYAKFTVLRYVHRSKASQRVDFRHRMGLKEVKNRKLSILKKIVRLKCHNLTSM